MSFRGHYNACIALQVSKLVPPRYCGQILLAQAIVQFGIFAHLDEHELLTVVSAAAVGAGPLAAATRAAATCDAPATATHTESPDDVARASCRLLLNPKRLHCTLLRYIAGCARTHAAWHTTQPQSKSGAGATASTGAFQKRRWPRVRQILRRCTQSCCAPPMSYQRASSSRAICLAHSHVLSTTCFIVHACGVSETILECMRLLLLIGAVVAGCEHEH